MGKYLTRAELAVSAVVNAVKSRWPKKPGKKPPKKVRKNEYARRDMKAEP